MNFRVILSQRAEADIESAVAYLSRHAPMAVQGWYRRLCLAIQTLEYLPTRCPVLEDLSLPEREIREMSFGKRRGAFRILFTITEDQVQVLHVRRACRGSITREDIE